MIHQRDEHCTQEAKIRRMLPVGNAVERAQDAQGNGPQTQ